MAAAPAPAYLIEPVSIPPNANISEICSHCSPWCFPPWCFSFPPPPPLEIPNHESDPTFSPLVIAIIGILVSAFLLVSYYTLVAKYCTNWEAIRRRFQRGHGESFQDDESMNVATDSWPVFRDGVEESVIRSIPVYKYRRGDGLVDCSDCTVCLSEFREDESVRLLPKCNHAFHVSCIDKWLQSHSNCPLCRANIAPSATAWHSDGGESRVTVHEEGLASGGFSENGAELEVSNSDPGSLNRSVQANDVSEDPSTDRMESDCRTRDLGPNMFELQVSRDVRAFSDLASRHRAEDRITEIRGEWQPMRRSASLGSTSAIDVTITELLETQTPCDGETCSSSSFESSHRKRNGHGFQALKGLSRRFDYQQNRNKGKTTGEASRSGILHHVKAPLTMKRSLSNSKFFLSRNRNSILPL
eukprot:TRINITY_DN25704_c0_g1_i1.p1 TRINITY_DN25704_c0_g1~~TRINITY_DN25704_c0_g1_i1.p1  ORF type:complete len:415 (+),score=32.24 TRINITY_DN25704_c0_g1_i1:284-1528(+)